jgi:hypothetical protein
MVPDYRERLGLADAVFSRCKDVCGLIGHREVDGIEPAGSQ